MTIPRRKRKKLKKNRAGGVGMPQTLWLNEFGSQVWAVFGGPPYLVGSCLTTKKFRDVDVRVILDDAEYKKMFGDPRLTNENSKWVAYCLAFSALGKQMTGLPIDFQIQQQTEANQKFKGSRSALGLIGLRMLEL